MRSLKHGLIILFILMGLAACAEQPTIPNQVETEAVGPTAVPQEAATIELEIVDEEAVQPIIIEETPAEAEPTLPPPTVTSETQPESPTVPPAKSFAITEFSSEWVVGETTLVRGTSPNNGEDVTVQLIAGPHMLVQGSTQVDDNGEWVLLLDVPQQVKGAALVKALTTTETAVQPIQLIDSDIDPLGIELTGVQPTSESVAVAGGYLFFSGDVTNAINRTIDISFWINNCTERIATQQFMLGSESASWNGVLILPREIADEHGCASIVTGDPASGSWREQIILMSIIQLEDDSAEGLMTLGNRLDNPFQAGASVTLYGSAFNLPEPAVSLEWVPEGDGEVVLLGESAVDDFGYWEITIQIPADLVEVMAVRLRSGEDDDLVSAVFSLPLNP